MTVSPSATSWPGWRSRRRWRRTAGRRCTGPPWRRSPRRRAVLPSPRGSRTTPRPPVTRTPCCGSRPRPPRARTQSAPIARPRRSARALALRGGSPGARARRAAGGPLRGAAFLADDCDEAIEAIEQALAVPSGAGRSVAGGRPAAPALGATLVPRRPLEPKRSASATKPSPRWRRLRRARAGAGLREHRDPVHQPRGREGTVAWGDRALDVGERLDGVEIRLHTLTPWARWS